MCFGAADAPQDSDGPAVISKDNQRKGMLPWTLHFMSYASRPRENVKGMEMEISLHLVIMPCRMSTIQQRKNLANAEHHYPSQPQHTNTFSA